MSTDPHEITIRVQALDGVWETLGADRYTGTVPEGVRFTFNSLGPDTCSFVLRRDPGAIHPDLATWAPVEIEVAGRVVWDGRAKEAPSSDGDESQISMQGEGWQYHLDDDVMQASYIHSSLTDFVDSRSFPTANLVTHVQAFNISVSDGAIVIGVQKDASVGAGIGGGVTLDLGPYSPGAITISADVATSFNTAQFGLYIIGHDIPDWTSASSGREDWKANVAMNDAGFVSAGNVITLSSVSSTKAHRYVSIFFYTNSPAVPVLAADYWFKITGLRLFSPGVGFPSGGQSITKADTIVKDVLSRTAFLTDTSGVQAGTFNIPDFHSTDLKSFREVLQAVNAYENYELKVQIGRRLSFKPRAAVPAYEIGNWSGADFQDASANSGDEIYNRVLVQGTGPDGAQMVVERAAAGPPWKVATEASVPNSGFEVNTSGWSVVDGTLTRDTAAFNSGVASGSISTVGGVANMSTQITGLKTGRAYLFAVAIRRDASITNLRIQAGPFAGGASYFDVTYTDADLPLGVWTLKTIPFLGGTTTSSTNINFAPNAAGSIQILHIDDVRVLRSAATLVDRRDFTRTKILPVSSAITLSSGRRIGDLYLSVHKTTPFKGAFKAVGQGGVRRVQSGATVHPAFLETGQLVRCSHRIDPDTGAWGREGTIVTIDYDHDSLTAQVALDDNRAGFETLLSRLAVVVGQRT